MDESDLAATVERADEARPTAPYAAYSYFDQLIERAAREDLPARVDKSLLRSWEIAGGNESSLLTSLRSLGLVDRQGRPTPDFRDLRLSAPRRQKALQRCFERAYPGLTFDLEPPLSPDELHDYFVEERGLTGQMVQKAMRFYHHLADAARGNPPTEERGPRHAEPPTPRPRPADSREVPLPSIGLSDRLSETPAARPVPTLRRTPRDEAPPAFAMSLSVSVPLDATEEELERFFRRVKDAWERVFGEE